MFEKIKRWWNGEDIFHKNNLNDPVIFIGWNNKKHWTAYAVLLLTFIAAVTGVVAILK